MLVDSHCHLEFKEFHQDITDVLNRAHSSGVGVILTICTYISEFYKIVEIAGLSDNLYCSIGAHPDNVVEEGLYTAAQIAALCASPKVIGIGETGLDFYRGFESKDQQIESFKEHIKAAQTTGLPLIIHIRDSADETLEILREFSKIAAFKAVIHCFTGTLEFAQECVKMGYFISFSGIVTFKNAKELQAVALAIPVEMMLVETDAPFLAPTPMRGKRNEPAFVEHTAKFIADLKGIPYKEFCDITSSNFFTLFNKAKRA